MVEQINFAELNDNNPDTLTVYSTLRNGRQTEYLISITALLSWIIGKDESIQNLKVSGVPDKFLVSWYNPRNKAIACAPVELYTSNGTPRNLNVHAVSSNNPPSVEYYEYSLFDELRGLEESATGERYFGMIRAGMGPLSVEHSESWYPLFMYWRTNPRGETEAVTYQPHGIDPFDPRHQIAIIE